ncbi:MAG: 4-(cytidine 5'-diphospho)-2-C-methyl-D-erythritol kinase [Bacteroidia bacterium]|nr:4-(cytidine 5'-diphospho)-2-C-methyl-D-erythritol kinase [Bacteroidia bacterium]
MISFPNAKINIGLNIISKRSDGFHDIESIFYPIQLNDVLEILECSEQLEQKVAFSSSGIDIPGEIQDNLCVKAYGLLDEKYNLPPVKIHLHKVIPIGAGLGGGSSDGAFAINMIDKLFDLRLVLSEKLDLAIRLGSDCSFFIENRPAFASGRGEVLQNIDLNFNEHKMVLINSNIYVDTADAYSSIIPKQPNFSLQEIFNCPVNEWNGKVVNDFEESVFSKYPEIGSIKAQLYEVGAVYASMSGSGSSVFGIFDKEIPSLNFPSEYFVVEV